MDVLACYKFLFISSSRLANHSAMAAHAAAPSLVAWLDTLELGRVLERALEAVGDNPGAGGLWRKCVAFEAAQVGIPLLSLLQFTTAVF